MICNGSPNQQCDPRLVLCGGELFLVGEECPVVGGQILEQYLQGILGTEPKSRRCEGLKSCQSNHKLGWDDEILVLEFLVWIRGTLKLALVMIDTFACQVHRAGVCEATNRALRAPRDASFAPQQYGKCEHRGVKGRKGLSNGKPLFKVLSDRSELGGLYRVVVT